LVYGQDAHIVNRYPRLGITHFRGAGGSAAFMPTFNQTLLSDLRKSSGFTIVRPNMLPFLQPQRPEDFRPGTGPGSMAEWANPPVRANHLVFGYAAEQNATFALYGYLFDVHQPTIDDAQLLAQRYFESMNDEGARRAAHNFAKDILTTIFGPSPGDPTNGREIIWVRNLLPSANLNLERIQ
jgi:hypothetical protein